MILAPLQSTLDSSHTQQVTDQMNEGTKGDLKVIRKRPVSFGNPALGTYHGYVYTLELNNQHQEKDYDSTPGNSISDVANINQLMAVNEADDEVTILVNHRLIAMVNVPPEQVPEGILNLARSHRPWIDHVRIVIGDDSRKHSNSIDQMGSEDADDRPSKETVGLVKHVSKSNTDDTIFCHSNMQQKSSSASVLNEIDPYNTSNSSIEEIAAAMILNEQNIEGERVPVDSNSTKSFAICTSNNVNRTYVALVELCSEDAAKQFVNDLHQQPFTILDENDVCNVYHVAALQGEDGVSLMSPFFAPATLSATTSTRASKERNKNNKTKKNHPSSEKASSSTSPNTSSISKDDVGCSKPTNTTPSTIDEHFNCAVCLERIEFDHRSGSTDSTNADNNVTTTTIDDEMMEYPASKTTSILTTVCNHTFHLDCLLQWQDSPCPVCRYDHSGLNEALSQCHICGTTENNYVCLICGVISCGDNNYPTTAAATHQRYSSRHTQTNTSTTGTVSCNNVSSTVNSLGGSGSGGNLDSSLTIQPTVPEPLATSNSHARKHYDETLHAYALNTDTQHVWDFAGQGYVHRLLQNKEDGKLVEVNDPYNTTSQERTLCPGLSDTQEGEMVHRKLENYASQYYTLLKSQLEQQRIFYQGRLEEVRREYGIHDSRSRYHHHGGNSATATTNQNTKRQQKEQQQQPQRKTKETSDLIVALKQERNQLRHRAQSIRTKIEKTKKDVTFLISMNESLEANRRPLQEQLEQIQQARTEQRTMFQQSVIGPLQERVTKLMLELEN